MQMTAFGRGRQVEREAEADRGAGRMADDGIGSNAGSGEQGRDVGAHFGEAAAPSRPELGKPLSGQVRGEDAEVPGQVRQQPAPGMRRGAGAVQEQQARAAAGLLDVPEVRACLDESAVAHVRPEAARGLPVHCRSVSADDTRVESRLASARGSAW